MLLNVALLSLVALSSAQKNPHYWGDRDGMVHLFEWKWSDIAAECERFLAPKGYGGVQVNCRKSTKTKTVNFHTEK